MHSTRLIIAFILLPLIYLYIIKLPGVFFFVLVATISALSQYEFLSMYRVAKPLRLLFTAISTVPVYLTYRYGELPFEALLTIFALMVLLRLFTKRDATGALTDLAPLLIGFFYVSLSLSFLIRIRAIGPEWIIFLGAVIWGADSFAYYIGKGFGRRKLYFEISPNKTVAGAYGAVGGAVLLSLLLSFLPGLDFSLGKIVITGVVLSIAGIAGDLAESMFKRDAGIKDSSQLIPGHGGFLDKTDGILFAGPVLYYILKLW